MIRGDQEVIMYLIRWLFSLSFPGRLSSASWPHVFQSPERWTDGLKVSKKFSVFVMLIYHLTSAHFICRKCGLEMWL